VNERAAIWLGAMAGAVVGGALGYLYLTDDGRELREDMEPAVSGLIEELRKAWEAAEQARTAVSEAWGAAAGPEDAVNVGTGRP
jgi:gas vesicle protein